MFVDEHRFTGFEQLSALLRLLTYLAAKNENPHRRRRGGAALVQPAQLAERAATLDGLSNGRFDFGISKGCRSIGFDTHPGQILKMHLW